MTSPDHYPSHPFSQVNPNESVRSDGLTGSEGGSHERDTLESSTTNTAPNTTRDTGQTPQPISSTANPGLACENGESTTRQGGTSVPAQLVWPADPAWALRWQAKIVGGALLPLGRADAAWRALRAATRKAKVEGDELAALSAEVADWLIARANALAPVEPPAPPRRVPPMTDLRGNSVGVPYDPEDYR